MDEIKTFETSTLAPTEVEERVSLPTSDDISRERIERELLTDIQDFDADTLKKATTEETTDPKVVVGDRSRSSSSSSSSSRSSDSPQVSSGGSSWEKVDNTETDA